MKIIRHIYFKGFTLWAALLLIFSMNTYSQTCENCGIGTETPGATLHVKGCGNTSATTSLKVENSDDSVGIFVRDDGKVGIGTSTPGAILDIDSKVSGVLIPRMTTTQRTGIATPADGLLVYDSDDDAFYYYANSAWKKITISDDQLWQSSGTDAYYSTGDIGIGTSNPVVELDVEGAVNIGTTTNTTAGNIRWNGTNFEGYNGSAWKKFDQHSLLIDDGDGTLSINGGDLSITGAGTSGATAFKVEDGSSNQLLLVKDNGSFVIGKNAGSSYTATTGVIIGENAGQSIANGYRSVFIGADAGKVTTTTVSNTFIGYTAGAANTSGSSNTFLGGYAGVDHTTGANNTFLGTSAGENTTTVSNNTFVGAASGSNNVTGDKNTYLGGSAGWNATSSENTFMGYLVGAAASGNNNTAIGSEASTAITSAIRTTTLGWWSGKSMTTGSYNTFLGGRAGQQTTSGTNNTFVGYLAGYNNQTGGSNIVISTNQIDLPTTSTSNYLNIGNLIYGEMDSGQVGIGVSNPVYALQVSGDAAKSSGGSSWQVVSDSRLKKEIGSFTDGLGVLRNVNPVTFKYTGSAGTKNDGKEQIGILAQDLQSVAPYCVVPKVRKFSESELVGFEGSKTFAGTEQFKKIQEDGSIDTVDVNYYKAEILHYDQDGLFFVLINAVKELDTKLTAKEAEINDLRTRIEALENQ